MLIPTKLTEMYFRIIKRSRHKSEHYFEPHALQTDCSEIRPPAGLTHRSQIRVTADLDTHQLNLRDAIITELNVEACGLCLDADTVGNELMQEKIMTPTGKQARGNEDGMKLQDLLDPCNQHN